MSCQKILDIPGNADIHHSKTAENKIDMKKLAERDAASKPDVINILENDVEETDEEDGQLLKDRSVNVDNKHNNTLEDKFDEKVKSKISNKSDTVLLNDKDEDAELGQTERKKSCCNISKALFCSFTNFYFIEQISPEMLHKMLSYNNMWSS